MEQELAWRSDRLAEAQARVTELERKLSRFQRMDDTSFGGVTMAQTWTDLWLWEAVLNDNPKIRIIFEMGTWKGGLSWWLWAQSQARDFPEFFTYDVIEPDVSRRPPGFVQADIFAKQQVIGQAIHYWEPCLVLCDGGNKGRELNTFSNYLQDSRSLIAVHDWGTEVGPEHVPPWLVMVYSDFCDELGSITRLFRVKEDDA